VLGQTASWWFADPSRIFPLRQRIGGVSSAAEMSGTGCNLGQGRDSVMDRIETPA